MHEPSQDQVPEEPEEPGSDPESGSETGPDPGGPEGDGTYPRPALFVVATPLGNLEDITYRAVKVLGAVDLVLAEDTRRSRILFDHYGIRTRCESYNDFNEERKAPAYAEWMKEGHNLAVICDAGTPGIADPAFRLVRAARAAGVPVHPVPGPCAAVAALVCSGLPTDHFAFENFPPKKSAQRLRKLQELRARYGEAAQAPTLVFYVSPHQLAAFLGEIEEAFGPDLRVVLAREMTKRFEEFLASPVSALREHYARRSPRGEYVLLFHPQNKG